MEITELVQMATDAVIGSVQKLQADRDVYLVRMVYEWRLHKDNQRLLTDLANRLMARFEMTERSAALVFLTDHDKLIKVMDNRVLIGGEYLFLQEGKEIVEALAAEAIERNPDKLRCSWCWNDKDACICTDQRDEMKYDY